MSEHVALNAELSSAENSCNRSDAEIGSSCSNVVDGQPSCGSHRLPPTPDAIIEIEAHKSLIEKDPLKKEEDVKTNSGHEMDTDCTKGKLAADGLLMAECRICQEEDHVANLESPCACSGSLKFAHRKCVQHWCNEKGDTTCEICRKPFESGYTIPHTVGSSTSINVGQVVVDVHEPQLFTISRDHQLFEGDYSSANARSAACLRSVALILMALLLLRHLLSMAAADTDDDASTFFMLLILRTAGFLLPFYIMARAFNALQYRNHHEEMALGPAEVAYLIQSGHARGVRIAVSPSTSA